MCNFIISFFFLRSVLPTKLFSFQFLSFILNEPGIRNRGKKGNRIFFSFTEIHTATIQSLKCAHTHGYQKWWKKIFFAMFLFMGHLFAEDSPLSPHSLFPFFFGSLSMYNFLEKEKKEKYVNIFVNSSHVFLVCVPLSLLPPHFYFVCVSVSHSI